MCEDTPLFKSYPSLSARLPRVSLGIWPTPVERLRELERRHGLPAFYVKRDDMSSGIYGGNKVRKLEFTLADALRRGYGRVMTMGAAGSNHVLATALHGRRLGLRTTALLFEQPCASYVRRNLLLDLANGVEMIWVPSIPMVPLYWAREGFSPPDILRGERPYRLPAGGSSPLGCIGYVNGGMEIAQQVRKGLIPEPAVVITAMGTHGTAAGLWLGLRMGGLASRVVGVAVVEKTLCNPYLWARLARRTASLLSCLDPGIEAPRARPSDLCFVGDYLGRGYGFVTPEDVAAIRDLWELEGLKLEGTYTGKAMAAALDIARELAAGESILFVNTYNSVDLSTGAEGLDYRRLPTPFQRFFEQPCLDQETL
ncbi:MAG: pyridoxal-phosphate dependent enzyme [Actinomycetota bacterium]|nr:pyridoxal-phosphate dependent enzyme [Actinomycetota bacterium]